MTSRVLHQLFSKCVGWCMLSEAHFYASTVKMGFLMAQRTEMEGNKMPSSRLMAIDAIVTWEGRAVRRDKVRIGIFFTRDYTTGKE